VPTERARRLIEALHEPTSNEERWSIADRYLSEEREETLDRVLGKTVEPVLEVVE